MKGFIEVTGHIDKRKHVVNVAHIIDFFYNKEQECAAITMSNSDYGKALGVRETCSELKALIEAATEGSGEPPCVDCDCPFIANKRGTTPDYEITGFNGTMNELNKLGIRKET